MTEYGGYFLTVTFNNLLILINFRYLFILTLNNSVEIDLWFEIQMNIEFYFSFIIKNKCELFLLVFIYLFMNNIINIDYYRIL